MLFERKEGELDKNFNIQILPSGKFFINENRFQLQLNTKITNHSGLLNIEVDAVANYLIHGNIQSASFNSFFYINAPAILFPYIRAYVSTLTTLSGYATVTLPTLNLTNLAEDLEKNTRVIRDS